MLHVFLFIIKIIGILLLAVIGLLLLIILSALLVPIRYKVNAEHGNTVLVDGRVNWLLHIISAKISYAGNILHIRVKVLWFTLFDNLKSKPVRTTVKPAKGRKTENSVKAEHGEETLHSEKQKMDFAKTADKAEETKKSKVKAFFLRIKEKIIHWFQFAAGIKNKISVITAFIKDKYNREGFQITYAGLKKLLKHILPRKLQSKIIFGTGDPCSTGQALGVMSILYSFYGDKIQITPDFENKRLEGIHYARGSIRLLTILIIVIKLIKDKRFKRLKNNFQILKEAL